MKGTTEKDKIPERFMPIKQAYETDDVQLYRYAQENEALAVPCGAAKYEAHPGPPLPRTDPLSTGFD